MDGDDDNDNKQLLDEVEHDIMNYQKRGLCYLPKPKAEADNRDTRFLNNRQKKTFICSAILFLRRTLQGAW